MKKNSGFTLIELIMYVGLLSILLAVMSQVFLATLSVRTESEGNASVSQDSRFIMSRIGYDVRRASEIQSPALGGTAGELVLTVPENGTDRTYRVSSVSGNLVLEGPDGIGLLNSTGSSVTTFSVTRFVNSDIVTDARDTVIINLGLTGTAQVGPQQSIDMTTAFGLRDL